MILFKSKYIILLCILSVVSAAVVASVFLPPVYEATATVSVTLGRETPAECAVAGSSIPEVANPTEIIDREVAILRS